MEGRKENRGLRSVVESVPSDSDLYLDVGLCFVPVFHVIKVPFWVVDTDYKHWAIVYSCTGDDSDYLSKSLHPALLSSNPKPTPNQPQSKPVVHVSDLSLRKRFRRGSGAKRGLKLLYQVPVSDIIG